VRERLDARTREWVREVRTFDAIPSTSDVLKEAARQGAPEGVVAVASVQTAGRGRHGRAWVSPPGNLFLSFLLRPEDPSILSLLPLAAGVAVAEALAAEGVEARLKWPNDVLVSARKLAGILAEASTGGAGVESVVVGIGANVNLRRADVPEDLRDTVTSLREETGRTHDVDAVAAAVLVRWTAWYDALRVDRRRVRAAWRDRSIDWWGRPVEMDTGGKRLVGVARDIDDAGALIVETADGARICVVSGEAREVRPTSS
jgi:BirA family transcriptional regulator, biotin operon repressor / biotin---[acetyl-CoA-carboxylase] ligase